MKEFFKMLFAILLIIAVVRGIVWLVSDAIIATLD